MVNEDANSHMIGSAMATQSAATFKQRLIELARKRSWGPPAGSLLPAGTGLPWPGMEQVLLTDQDNALILDDQYDPRHHGEYLPWRWTNRVCDGLPELAESRTALGGIMATKSEVANDPVTMAPRNSSTGSGKPDARSTCCNSSHVLRS